MSNIFLLQVLDPKRESFTADDVKEKSLKYSTLLLVQSQDWPNASTSMLVFVNVECEAVRVQM